MIQRLQSAFVDFYRLEYGELFCLLAAATLCFLLLQKYCRGKRWWKLLAGAVLLAWALLAVYTTVASRGETGNFGCQLIPFHSYREIRNGGNPEIYRSNLMNAVLFYPGGLLLTSLLPVKWPRWVRVLLATLLCGTLSAGIEYAQYLWQLGRVEIDDVIHNTAGAALGGLAALLTPLLLRFAGLLKILRDRCFPEKNQ